MGISADSSPKAKTKSRSLQHRRRRVYREALYSSKPPDRTAR